MSVVNRIESTGTDRTTDTERTVMYHVETTARVTAREVLADSAVPQPGESLSTEPSWIAQSGRDAESKNDDRSIWTVTATYKKRTSSSGGVLIGSRNRIVRYSISAKRYQIALKWAYGKPPGGGWTSDKQAVTNSAGDPFDPPLEAVARNVILHWEQRENPGFTPWGVIDLIGTINEASIDILGKHIEAESAKLNNAEPRWSGEEYVTRYEIEIGKEHSIVPLVIDQGYRKREGGELVNIQKSELSEKNKAEDVDDPVFLDGAGNIHPDELSGGGPITDPYKFYWRGSELNDWNTTLDLVQDSPA